MGRPRKQKPVFIPNNKQDFVPILVDAPLLEGFVKTFLWERFDAPKVTPKFHSELWDMFCSAHPRVAVAAPRGHGKAQPLDSKVLTVAGWKTIGDLKIGDKIFAPNGKLTKVTHLHPITKLPTYKVETGDQRITYCNEEHLWPVITPRNTGEQQVVTALKDFKDSYQALRLDKRDGKEHIECYRFLPLSKPIQFNKQELELDPYILGIWLGDGHSEGGRITSDDPEIFKYFDLPVKKSNSGKYLYRVEGLTTILSYMGLQNNKHIPEKYFISSIEDRLKLLQGLMDTDGSCHYQGKIAYFYNTNRKLIDGVITLVRSLGGIAKVFDKQTTCKGKIFSSWVVSIKLPKDFNPFRLRRKADIWVYDDVSRTPITNIELSKEVEVRCITVDGGLYLTDDFIVTHNSTSGTFAYSLASALFGFKSFIVIVGATEDLAVKQLQELRVELTENEDLISTFNVQGLSKDNEGELVCHVGDHAFKIIAKGAGQKLRGIKWRNRRPDLIIIDDLEDDEAVESQDRRIKLREWFMNALLPLGGDSCLIRMVGTILHGDSLLNRLLTNKTWRTACYKAHEAFDDFSNILWPEKFTEQRLRDLRDNFIAEGNDSGYSKEYLNIPVATTDRYFRPSWFKPMEGSDFEQPMTYYAAMDLAISKENKANKTSITVGGLDPQGFLHIIYNEAGKWDSMEIIEKMFEIHERFKPDLFGVEKGQISLSIAPFLETEQRDRGIYLNLEKLTPSKDKQIRARSLQARMKTGTVKFDTEAEWYPDLFQEMTTFPRGQKDDRVDSTAYIGLMLAKMVVGETQEELDMAELEYEEMMDRVMTGRSTVTGY